MTTLTCKKCNDFILGKSWCVRKGLYKSPWDEMCDEEKAARAIKIEEWLAGHGKGQL